MNGYLSGSACAGSGNAPWQLVVSPASGSDRALRKLTDAAHDRGVRILLWTSPGHLSNSSPLLVQRPDWLTWRHNGTPENAGYRYVAETKVYSGEAYYRALSSSQGRGGLRPDDRSGRRSRRQSAGGGRTCVRHSRQDRQRRLIVGVPAVPRAVVAPVQGMR